MSVRACVSEWACALVLVNLGLCVIIIGICVYLKMQV